MYYYICIITYVLSKQLQSHDRPPTYIQIPLNYYLKLFNTSRINQFRMYCNFFMKKTKLF